ncbi:MAG: hypothetical protein M1831_003961 [Alyxoria varia]|nr:MAG: hypothetical protein M1831_003961 [Alyxoria varia]
MAKKDSQHRTHAGHSHSHSHAHGHDNTYLTSANKHDAGVRITRIGLYVNLGMAVSKGIGGYVFNSKALLADAIHSLTDLVSDIMTLATVSWSLKPPSERFPGGYGKVESLGSLGVSGILLASGVMMGWAAVMALFQQFIPGFEELAEQLGLLHLGHGHDHSHTDLGPNLNAAWLAAGSIAVKEWLYRATLKVARERKSNVLASNAYHHRVDSLTALVALLMIGGSHFLSNASWLDPVGGLVISLMVIQAGWGNTRDSLLELADVSMDETMKKKTWRAVDGALDDLNAGRGSGRKENKKAVKGTGVADIRTVQGIKAGQSYLIDVELAVPGSTLVAQTQEIEKAVRERIGLKVRGAKRVKVRFVPREQAPEAVRVEDEFISADVSPRSSPEPEEQENGHRHSHKH